MYISIYQAIKIFVSTVIVASLLDMLVAQWLKSSSYADLFKRNRIQKTSYWKLFKSIAGNHTMDFIYSRTLFFPLAELVFGASIVLSIYSVGFSWFLLPRIIFAILLVLLLVVPLSLEYTTTPHIITRSGIILGIATSLVNGLPGLLESVLGAFVGFVVLFAVYQLGFWFDKLAGRDGESIGGGTVYAMTLAGAFCGFPGVIQAFMIAAVLGGVVSSVWIFYLRIRREHVDFSYEMPYSPFMVLGGAIVIYIFPLLPPWLLKVF